MHEELKNNIGKLREQLMVGKLKKETPKITSSTRFIPGLTNADATADNLRIELEQAQKTQKASIINKEEQREIKDLLNKKSKQLETIF